MAGPGQKCKGKILANAGSIQESGIDPIFKYLRNIKRAGSVPGNSDWVSQRFCKFDPSSTNCLSGNQVLDASGARWMEPRQTPFPCCL